MHRPAQHNLHERFTKALLSFLILALLCVYAGHRLAQLTPNSFMNVSAFLAGAAGVIWSAHDMSKKLARKLDSILVLSGLRSNLRVISAVLGFGVGWTAATGWYYKQTLDAVNYTAADWAALMRQMEIEAIISLGITLAILVALKMESYRFVSAEVSSKAKKSATFLSNLRMVSSWVGLYFLVFYFVDRLPFLIFGVAVGLICFYFTLNVLRVLLSPVELSEDLRDLAGGPSITLAMVFLLAFLSFISLLVGLLIV